MEIGCVQSNYTDSTVIVTPTIGKRYFSARIVVFILDQIIYEP